MSDDVDWTLISFDEPKAGAVKAAPADPLAVNLWRKQIRKAAATELGTCPKCKKHIGRGVAFHIKACKADDSARNA